MRPGHFFAEALVFFDPQQEAPPAYLQHAYWLLGHAEIWIAATLILAAIAWALLQRATATATKGPQKSPQERLWRLWAYGAIAMILLAAGLALWSARAGSDRVYHDTYFVVVQLNFAVLTALGHPVIAALLYAFPNLARRLPLGAMRLQFAVMTLGALLMIAPGPMIATNSMPRRYTENASTIEFGQAMASAGTVLYLASILFFVGILAYSLLPRRAAK